MSASIELARHFGANLRRVRREAGISQEELGFRYGLHRTEIGLLERGGRVPRTHTVVKLASGLGLHIECPLFEGMTWSPGTTTTTPGSFVFPPVQREEDAPMPDAIAPRRCKVTWKWTTGVMEATEPNGSSSEA